MAGYVLALVRTDAVQTVAALFDPSEVQTTRLSNDRHLVYVTNSGSLSSGRAFHGYAINHERNLMTFEGAHSSDLPDPLTPVEGCYFSARYSRGTVECSADVLGLLTMQWFQDDSATVISDSFLTLLHIRGALGLPNDPDERLIYNRMWLNSMGCAQLSSKTFCRQIAYCTPGSTITIDVASGEADCNVLNLVDYYGKATLSHSEAVELSAKRMVRTIKTYVQAGGMVSLAMSGGSDSRACLAAVLAADIDDHVHIACSDNGSADFQVVKELSETFNFPLNKSSRAVNGKLKRNDLAAAWGAMSLGVYDQLYMPEYFRKRDFPVFPMGGQGAEAIKGNFGWRRLTDIQIPNGTMQECLEGIQEIGGRPNDPWGSEWHYLGFRSALHTNRAIVSADYISRPIAQIPAIALSRSSSNELPEPKKGTPSIVSDLSIKLNPDLASFRYDDRRKDLSATVVQERLDRLGGRLDASALLPYRVAGQPIPAPGILESHLNIARDFGLQGNLSLEVIKPIVQDIELSIDFSLPTDVLSYSKSLEMGYSDRIPATSRGASALGKLLALSAVVNS